MSEPITVFVVDDEIVIAATLAVILKNYGFDASPFSEPRQALQAARLHAPDLLISDVVMAGMSGVDLAIQIQTDCPRCKVLLFSGHSATGDLLKLANRAGHDFELLSKPVHPNDLLATIRKLHGAQEDASIGIVPLAARHSGSIAAIG